MSGWADRRIAALVLASLYTAGVPSAYPAIRLSAQPDPWPILDRASTVYQGVQTLTATFVQIVTNPMVGEPDTTRGRLFQQRPGRFAMRFTVPAGDRIVADGRYLWVYTPSTDSEQVIRSRIPQTGTGPNLIGQFVERPRERYTAHYVRADSTAMGWADVIALTPRDDSQPYSLATIWVGRNDGLVRRLDLVETSGQERSVRLSNLQPNTAVAPREFRFSAPRGVRVVDQ